MQVLNPPMPHDAAHRDSLLWHLYRSSPRLRRKVRGVKNRLTFDLVRLGIGHLRRRSLDEALALADQGGDWAYSRSRRNRSLALGNLALAFGDSLTEAARERIVRACFRNVLRSCVEMAKFDVIRTQLDDYVTVEGWENADAVLSQGKGAIVVTGHLGNWELLTAYFALKGLPVAAVARRIYNPRFNQLIVGFRTENGVQTIFRESPAASREILSVLRRNGILAMLVDQDTKVPSVSLPLFGRPARTSAAAAALALKKEVPVVAAFAQRRPGGGHRLSVLPPFTVEPTGDRRRDVVELTRALTATLEERVRANPVEWIWWHRRWRRPPTPRLDLGAEVQ